MYHPGYSLTLPIFTMYCPLWTCCPSRWIHIHPSTHGSSMSHWRITQLTSRLFMASSDGSSQHQVLRSIIVHHHHTEICGWLLFAMVIMEATDGIYQHHDTFLSLL